MKKFKILSISSSRADFNYLKNFLELVNGSKEFNFKLLITGTHLSETFGNTISEIKKSSISNLIEMEVSVDRDDSEGIINSYIDYNKGFFKVFIEEKPDAIILLGDRYEIFIASGIATFLNIPIIHLHGGELTYGSFDDAFRHSISKMSKLHFTSTEVYRKRVIQMGEDKENVHNVGAFSLNAIKDLDFLNIESIKNKLKLKNDNIATIIVHPETNHGDNKTLINSILESTLEFTDIDFVLISSNSDPGNSVIRQTLKIFQETHKNYYLFSNLDLLTYASLIKNSIFLLGNSSSGIIEAPFLNTEVLNIGTRQEGRVRGDLVNDLRANRNIISKKIREITRSKKLTGLNLKHPYFKNNTETESIAILKKQIKRLKDLKVFNDL